ncbi:hypothetical protein HL42_3949 [Trichophyton rubrum]|nr:hypothetical protein HL42_3949 [Trichophyton rubrum]
MGERGVHLQTKVKVLSSHPQPGSGARSWSPYRLSVLALSVCPAVFATLLMSAAICICSANCCSYHKLAASEHVDAARAQPWRNTGETAAAAS